MNRRFFLTSLVSTFATSALSAGSQSFLNGELNNVTKTFDWSNGGGDPLWRQWRQDGFKQTLAIPRLNLLPRVQRGLQQTLSRPPQNRVNLAQVYEGKVIGDVMVSGNGVLALKPRIVTHRWRRGRSTMASWYVWTDPKTRERWEVIVPDVCHNLVLRRLGEAVPCFCVPEKGDACIV